MIDIKEHRERLAQLEENYAKAEQGQQVIRDLRSDLARLEARRDGFKAHGKNRIEVPDEAHLPGLPPIELEPRQSRLTGNELAAGVQVEIDHLEREIKRHEVQVASLLKG
jgi:chromosome segregation ATPase